MKVLLIITTISPLRLIITTLNHNTRFFTNGFNNLGICSWVAQNFIYMFYFFCLYEIHVYDKIEAIEGKGLHNEKTCCRIGWTVGIARIC